MADVVPSHVVVGGYVSRAALALDYGTCVARVP